MPTNDNEVLAELKKRVMECAQKHSKRTDSFFYNGGTVIVLFFTTAATLLPEALVGSSSWIPRVLTGFAAFWIGLERALNFGARWRFHKEMENGYNSIVDMIDFYPILDNQCKYPENAGH